MPLKLSQLLENQKKLKVEINGEVLEVSYRPSALTPAMETKIQDLFKENYPLNGMAHALAGILIDWDVTNEEGEKVKPALDFLLNVAGSVLLSILQAVYDDTQVSKDERKN